MLIFSTTIVSSLLSTAVSEHKFRPAIRTNALDIYLVVLSVIKLCSTDIFWPFKLMYI
jgi:hypothetical protein